MRIGFAMASILWCVPAKAAPPVNAPPFIGSWAAPPVVALAGADFGNFTVRQTVHVTMGGATIRLRISNQYGAVPLVVSAAHIAGWVAPDQINPATDTAFSFGGAAGLTIPPGAVAVSDALGFAVSGGADYLVSMFTPVSTGAPTYHAYASEPLYFAAGNQVSATIMSGEVAYGGIVFISGLDVQAASKGSGGIAALGDSITDGYGSTPGTDTSWPDDLAVDLAAQGKAMGVMDAGISGNQLLADAAADNNQSGLARFDRDVLVLPGVKTIVVALGINDLALAGTNPAPSAGDLLAGYQQLIGRAHEKGLLIYGATITPLGGSQFYNSVFEGKRETVNDMIGSIGFDGVVGFDAAVRDPSMPTQLRPRYDSGDHVHPNSAGYLAMAKAARSALGQ